MRNIVVGLVNLPFALYWIIGRIRVFLLSGTFKGRFKGFIYNSTIYNIVLSVNVFNLVQQKLTRNNFLQGLEIS